MVGSMVGSQIVSGCETGAHEHLQGQALQARVASDIAGTRDTRIGHWACHVERVLLNRGVRLPFGIRGLTVVRRPEEVR
jgi:hypothetical protein